MLDEIETHPADAAVKPCAERAVVETLVDNGNAAVTAVAGTDGVEGRTIIGAVAACLHDHRARDTEKPMHGRVGLIVLITSPARR